jgi:uncharacterized Ntn-hydrolase superfamily protein
MPPLFVLGPSGNSELVNDRARQNSYVVDRLFAAAELRLGDKDSERRVRIVRTDGRPDLFLGESLHDYDLAGAAFIVAGLLLATAIKPRQRTVHVA